MSERKDFSFELLDCLRTKTGWTTTMILKDGRSEQVQSQELKDRLRFNDIMNPIVSALREVYGVQHKVRDIGVSFEVGRVSNLVMDAEGPFRLVPEEIDPNLQSKCRLLALALLSKTLTKNGFVTNDQKDEVVIGILQNRFFEDVKIRGDIKNPNPNLSNLISLCLEEAMHGYNVVELQQKEKQMQNKKEQQNKDEEYDDTYLNMFNAFSTSQMVQDRLASLDGLGAMKKGDETGSKK